MLTIQLQLRTCINHARVTVIVLQLGWTKIVQCIIIIIITKQHYYTLAVPFSLSRPLAQSINCE